MGSKNGIKILLNIVVLAVALMAVTANARIVGELGVLDVSGTNPATGAAWEVGDTYRLTFVTSTTRNATSTDIADYNAFVQDAAEASTLANLSAATWNAIGSTETVTAKANTGTDSGTGEAIFLMDGTTVFAKNYADLWNGTSVYLNIDENGVGDISSDVFAGTMPDGTQVDDRYLGTTIPSKGNPPTQVVVETGKTWKTGSGWIRIYNAGPTSKLRFFALSDPLAVQDANFPSVYAGDNWITWSGQAVTLDPNVVNNDEEPQRNLSFAWTAEPSDGVVFTPNANVEAPTVTITKAADTGDATVVTLTLAVILEGEQPITDIMTIDVYDDACQAGKASGCVMISAGDLNGSCFTDIEDFAVLAHAWLADYDVPDLSMVSETWLEGDVLNAPTIMSVTVPDVTGLTESEAQSIVAALGLTTSTTFEYDEVVELNYVISQDPIADLKASECGNVNLVVSKGQGPASEITVKEVYLAQTHVHKPDDLYSKLVGNRPTLLKVQVVAPDGTAVPQVTAVLSVDDETTTLTLDAPLALQDLFEAKLGKVQHKYDDSFATLIPAEWIRPGLSIEVKAGNDTVSHDIKVGAPSVVKMKMFDVHYFGLGTNDYPAGTLEELEAKWPVSDLTVERIRDIDFQELVVPARSGVPYVRVSSKQDYYDQTGLGFDGEQAAALQWSEALSASGGNFDVAMQYINIIGVPAGGQAGGFDGVGGISVGILNHELGHALSLPHWGDNGSYPYKGEMYGIEPQPGVYMGTHTGPIWAFDLPTMTFIPPTVQENSVGGEVGYYKRSPMQGGGWGDQEDNFLMRHFSDYAVTRMQNYIEGKVAVLREGEYYKWNDEDGDYTWPVASDGVCYPIEEDVQVISVMAATTVADPNVNMVYPPIGPYEGNLIRIFDPTIPADRTAAAAVFAPSGGCDFSLRVVQGGQTKTYMLQASGTEGSPLSNGTLKTAAINLRASDGAVTQVELLHTPDAEKNGLPGNPEVLHTWTE